MMNAVPPKDIPCMRRRLEDDETETLRKIHERSASGLAGKTQVPERPPNSAAGEDCPQYGSERVAGKGGGGRRGEGHDADNGAEAGDQQIAAQHCQFQAAGGAVDRLPSDIEARGNV